jgi:hypothetical protein
MNTTKDIATVAIAFIIAIVAIALFLRSPMQGQASVTVGNEYYATTTYAADPNPERVLLAGNGTLGSVIITGANTGRTFLYNATTSNISQRAPGDATSTILIAEFPVSAAVGTYTFDVAVKGLLLVSTGLEATSTITYR